MKGFLSKSDQIHSFRRMDKALMKKFIFMQWLEVIEIRRSIGTKMVNICGICYFNHSIPNPKEMKKNRPFVSHHFEIAYGNLSFKLIYFFKMVGLKWNKQLNSEKAAWIFLGGQFKSA